jgi:hypothetical protein
MAISPGTTNLAVSRDIADRLRELAKDNNMTTLEVTNQLLTFALNQGELELEVRKITVRPKKKPGGRSAR